MKEITRQIYDEKVICYEADDIIERLDFKSEEEALICRDIVNSVESIAAEFLKEQKPAFLPFVGTMSLAYGRLEVYKKKGEFYKMRKDVRLNIITKEEYKVKCAKIINDSENNKERNQEYLENLRTVRAFNQNNYRFIIHTKGLKAAEKYIETLASFKVVEFDQEVEDLYNNLED